MNFYQCFLLTAATDPPTPGSRSLSRAGIRSHPHVARDAPRGSGGSSVIQRPRLLPSWITWARNNPHRPDASEPRMERDTSRATSEIPLRPVSRPPDWLDYGGLTNSPRPLAVRN
ncbi:hypothetical protein MTO96_049295 [Rhipicephalus appendiculatus]